MFIMSEAILKRLKVILSQDSICGVKSGSQCVQQILKLTYEGYMSL